MMLVVGGFNSSNTSHLQVSRRERGRGAGAGGAGGQGVGCLAQCGHVAGANVAVWPPTGASPPSFEHKGIPSFWVDSAARLDPTNFNNIWQFGAPQEIGEHKGIPSFWVDSAARIDVATNKIMHKASAASCCARCACLACLPCVLHGLPSTVLRGAPCFGCRG